jgi:AMMECR1 domain-containing protein
MIKAIAKLIYPRKFEEMRTALLQAVQSASALCPCPWRCCIVALCILGFFALPSGLQAQQISARSDPSLASITVSHADCVRAARRQSAAAKHEFIGLPEIARQTIVRYFGRNNCAQSASLQGKPASSSLASGVAAGKPEPERRYPQGGYMEWAASLKVEKRFLQAAGVFVTLSKNGKTRACWGSVYPHEANIVAETVSATLGALARDYRFRPVSEPELKDLKIQVTVIRGLAAVSNVKMIDPFKEGIMVRSGGRGAVILPGEAVDAYYELVLARLKAGIKPDEPCQIYKIRTEIYD